MSESNLIQSTSHKDHNRNVTRYHMRKIRNVKLNLLALENRLTPVTFAYDPTNFTLTVVGTAGSETILVSQQPNGTVNVYETPGSLVATNQTALTTLVDSIEGTTPPPPLTVLVASGLAVSSWIDIKPGTLGSVLPDTVIVNVDAGLLGNCSITTNNGDDLLVIRSRNNNRPTIGRVQMNGGPNVGSNNGNDKMFIFAMNVTAATFINSAISSLPGDVFELSDSNVQAINVNDAIVGIDDVGGVGNTITGMLAVQNTHLFSLGALLVNNIAPAQNGVLVIDPLTVVNGGVTYVGSSATDGTYIHGTINPLGILPGNVLLIGGAGAGFNEFILGGFVTGFYTTIGANGIDNIGLLGSAVIGGPAAFTMGNGNNTYSLAPGWKVGTISGVTVLTITGGTGNDVVGPIGGIIGRPGVATHQTYYLGAGDNSLIWLGTYLGTTTGQFKYTGQGGTDQLEMYNANAFRLYASMGAGSDTISLGANFFASYALLDFGPGLDTFFNFSVFIPNIVLGLP